MAILFPSVRILITIIFLVGALSAFTGCGSGQDVSGSPEIRQELRHLAYEVAVFKAVEEAGEGKLERLQKIREIALLALGEAASDDTKIKSAAALELYLRASINWAPLTPAERLIADRLITLAVKGIQERMNEVEVQGHLLPTVRAVLQAFVTAADSYLPPESK